MIIIRQQGRLGNQMFQYALYRSLEEMGKQVFLDCEHPVNPKEKNQLDIFKKIRYQRADREESERLGNCKWTVYNRICRKLKHPTKRSHYMEKPDDSLLSLSELDGCYLDGFWQSERYFIDIREKILQEFEFPSLTDGDNIKCLERIQSNNSVSIHIRRGDYVSSKYMGTYGGICTPDYYQKAVQYIESRVENARYFVFTDDPDWVLNNFVFPEHSECVTHNISSTTSYVDMYLMSQCKHNIIANSSYSWWGAWLNQNAEKIVVMPGKWTNHHDNKDIVCKDWICIDLDEEK